MNTSQIRRLNNSGYKNILSKAIVEDPDRDISNVIIECYTNLSDTQLAAYSIGIVDTEGQFLMEWKEDLHKSKNIEKLAKAADILHLENAFYELRLKYIIRPSKIKDGYKISAIDNTILNFMNETSDYQYKNSILVNDLKRLRDWYVNNPYVDTIENWDPDDQEALESLFVEEQKVVIPMIHKTGKYKIDGYNYYGVFNDSYGCYISTDGKFSFKLTRHGSSGTYFIRIRKVGHGKNAYDVLEALYFGNSVNPFFMLCAKPIKEVPQEEIIPYTDNEVFNKILDATYKQAIEIEELGDRPKGKIVPRLQPQEVSFRNNYIEFIHQYASILDDNFDPQPMDKKREFVHLSKFDEDIYNAINNPRRKIKNKLLPSDAVKRKNLSPFIVYTTMKQGFQSGNRKMTRMFESSTTSPNPIDLFKLFQYIKISQHTQTRKKSKSKAASTPLPLNSQMVKYDNMRYIGTFAPKNAADMEASLILHFNIDEDHIVKRNNFHYEIFKNNIMESEVIEEQDNAETIKK